MTRTLILLLVALGAANAMDNFFWLEDYAEEMGKVGRGCCLPTQWEGRVGAMHITKRFLRPKFRASDSKVGLDYTGKKVATRSLVYCPKARKTFETRTVVDFNAKKAYFIFKNKCKTFNVKKPMSRPCIPDFFKQFGHYTYGVGSGSLGLTPYGYRNGSLSVFSVVTSGTCAPVKGAYRVKRRFHSRMGSYQYYNITTGNKDKDLYTVPDFCKKSNDTEQEKSSLWRRFKKYVRFSAEQEELEFNSDSELESSVNGDPLTQLMNILDGSASMMQKVTDHKHKRGRHDRWSQRRQRHRED